MDGAWGWYASISGMIAAILIAAILIAADLGRRATGWGFMLFVTTSFAWIVAGVASEDNTIVWQNIVLFGTNCIGVYRWLIRKPRSKNNA